VTQDRAPEFRGAPHDRSDLQRSGLAPRREGISPRRSPTARAAGRKATSQVCDALRRFLPPNLSAGLFAAVLAVSAHAGEPELRPLSRDEKPYFALPDLSGERVDLSAQRGRAVLVHFFATWCEPCRAELPALRRLAERSAGAIGVIAVSVGEPALRVRRFAETMPVNFPVLLDQDRAVARSWQVASLPTTYILDRDLDASLVAESEVAWDALDIAKLIEQLAGRDVRRTGPTSDRAVPNAKNREE
jgi:peroxiredoxin